MNNFISSIRTRVKTRACSLRLDEDLYSYIRAQNLNLNSILNHLLRRYLYIHSVDSSITFGRLNAKVPGSADIHIDVYSDISDLNYLDEEDSL